MSSTRPQDVLALEGMTRVVEHVAAAHLCHALLRPVQTGYPVTVNDGPAAEQVLAVARDLLGDSQVLRLPTPVTAAAEAAGELRGQVSAQRPRRRQSGSRRARRRPGRCDLGGPDRRAGCRALPGKGGFVKERQVRGALGTGSATACAEAGSVNRLGVDHVVVGRAAPQLHGADTPHPLRCTSPTLTDLTHLDGAVRALYGPRGPHRGHGT